MRALIILLICTTNAMAQVQVSNNTRADVIEIEKSWQANGRKVSVEMRKRFAINSFHGKECVSFVAVVNDHFDKEVLAERSVLSGSRVGDIVSLRYPIDQLDEIL